MNKFMLFFLFLFALASKSNAGMSSFKYDPLDRTYSLHLGSINTFNSGMQVGFDAMPGIEVDTRLWEHFSMPFYLAPTMDLNFYYGYGLGVNLPFGVGVRYWQRNESGQLGFFGGLNFIKDISISYFNSTDPNRLYTSGLLIRQSLVFLLELGYRWNLTEKACLSGNIESAIYSDVVSSRYELPGYPRIKFSLGWRR